MFMKTTAVAAALLALAASGANAQNWPQEGEDGPIPPVSAEARATARPGDEALSCQAIDLEAEAVSARLQVAVAGLNAASGQMTADMMAQQQQATARMSAGPSAGQTVAGLAAGFIPGAGLAMSLAQSVGSTAPDPALQAQQAQQQQRAQELQAAATHLQGVAPLGYRLEYLAHLAREEGC